MLTVSQRFLDSLRESHTVSVAARVYRPSAPTVAVDVPVVGGEVTCDRDARVRRQATLLVAFALGEPFTTDTVRELPFGGYAAVERGIRYPDGTVERVQLGMFRVESVAWNQLEGQATLTLSDRYAQIQDEPFTSPYAPTGLKPSDAAVAAVQEVFGSTIAYHVLTDPASEPSLADVVYEEDRAAAVGDLASSVAAVTLFDEHGDFVIRPRDTTPPVAWQIDAGDRGSLAAANETLDRSNVRNGVLVKGQATADQPPFVSLAVNDDPASPTRWGGPFGKIVMVSSSTAVSSQAAADSAAASLLNLRLGLSRTVTLQALPNPALEPDDRVEVTFADGRVETMTINATRIALDAGGGLEITTTSQFLPDLSAGRFRLYTGHAAWRQLEDAVTV